MSAFLFWTALFLSPMLQCEAGVKEELQPLGSDQPPEGRIDEILSIAPKKFFEHFVRQKRPVIIRKALDGTAPMHLWNDIYLSKEHGNVEVNVDLTKTENRSAESREMALQEFLLDYKRKSYYLIDTLPVSMQKEFPLPLLLSCRGFLDRLQVQCVGMLFVS